MKFFKTQIENQEGEFEFECYENTHPINIGDAFIFFFGGIADVQICDHKDIHFEINPIDKFKVDSVNAFWKRCYKIKKTNLDHKYYKP